MKKNGISVIIKSHTWARDSHGLFDYESSKVTKSQIKTASQCYIIRKGNEVSQIYQPTAEGDDVKYLTQLQIIEGNEYKGHFAVKPVPSGDKPLKATSCEKNWLVVRCLSATKGYMITEGDVIKMGRMKFRVKELKGADPSKRIKDFNLADLVNFKGDSEDSEDDEQGVKFDLPCRICLSENYTPDNPLICPCNCDGTMKYIHLKCLQRALRSKVTTRASEKSLSFSWKTMNCDLCKRPYPYKFILRDQVIELIQIPKPPEKFVVLEGLCKDKNSSKWLHVISLNSKGSIQLGRGNDCELRMTDISVSRMHAMIRLIDENYYLEDKDSKFGTLVQVKRPLALDSNNDLNVQTGRTLLTISMKKPWSLIPACFRASASPFDLFLSPYHAGVIPLLPINTGIPLSIDDPEELLLRTGINGAKKAYKANDNLMFEHGQLGMNSSLEDEGIDGVEAVQEVIIAGEPEEARAAPSVFEAAENVQGEDLSGEGEDVREPRRSHSFV